MTAAQTSKLSSIPRRHKLWMVLCLVAGRAVASWIWPETGSVPASDWPSYASALASTGATMVGLTVAVTAVLYALLGTPLLKFLHERGALNRLLFDLMVCAALWLGTLGLGLLGALPGHTHVEDCLQWATTFAVAGLLYFGPIGYAFWLLLNRSGVEPAAALAHDFSQPTDPF